jgi:hypothetical protein
MATLQEELLRLGLMSEDQFKKHCARSKYKRKATLHGASSEGFALGEDAPLGTDTDRSGDVFAGEEENIHSVRSEIRED